MEKLRARQFVFVCLSMFRVRFFSFFQIVYFQIFNIILYMKFPIKRNHLIIIQCSTIVSSFRNTFAQNLHAIFCADLNIFFAAFCFNIISVFLLQLFSLLSYVVLQTFNLVSYMIC